MQQETNVPTLKQGLETFKPDYSEQKGNRVDGSKPIWKYETGPGGTSRGKPAMGDMLRKSSDTKPGVSSKSLMIGPKESILLLLPPKRTRGPYLNHPQFFQWTIAVLK